LQSANRHIDATVQDKMKRISPRCSHAEFMTVNSAIMLLGTVLKIWYVDVNNVQFWGDSLHTERVDNCFSWKMLHFIYEL